MKKRLKLLTCALLTLALLTLGVSPTIAPFGVDVVSAATGETSTPAAPAKPAPAKPAPAAPAKPAAAAPAEVKVPVGNITRLLVEGSFGAEVELLQAMLNANGYMLKVDGFFGAKTTAAVKDFQSKNGLKTDGIVGPKVLAKLAPVAAAAEKVMLKLGKAEYAAHGTKCFTVAGVVMAGDKIAAALLDDYQFMAAIGSVGVPNSAADFGKNYPAGMVLGSKRANADQYSENMKVKANATTPVDKSLDAIQAYVVGKTVAELEATLAKNTKEQMVDVVSGATLVDTDGYIKTIVAAAKAAKNTIEVEADALKTLKLGKAELAAHGTKCFTVAFTTVTGGKVVGALLDDYQFMAKEGSVGVPNSDADFGKNYPEGMVLGSKLANAAQYSANMKKKANATLPVDVSLAAIEKYTTGKAVKALEAILKDTPKEKMVDAVSGATLVDTFGYVSAIVAAANSTIPVADAVTTASLVNNEAAFEKSIGKEGTWIISILKNLTFDKPIVLDGEFKNTKTPPAVARKISLYAQDENKNVTARYTLVAPKLTINSPNARLQSGTFKGDLFVNANNFALVDTKVVGNVYFANQKAKDTFTIDNKSSIVGKQFIAGVDAVSTASLVQDTAGFEKAISKDGVWIICALNNLTFNKPLVVEGDFLNTKTPPVSTRKIALYSQDENRKTISSFTLTAPKMTIKSPDANISKGTFKGDLYVSAKNFKLVEAKVDGNVYFTTQEAKDTFTMDEKSVITGKKILFDADAVTTATPTQVQNIAAFEKAISKDGYWIIVPIIDLTTDKALVVEGTFHDKNDPTKALKRKIGLYTHNDPADKKKATHSFTLTAPSLTIKSPFATLQYGYFVGDIYVEAENFSLVNNKVTGNIYFATQAAKDTFTMDANSSVSGVQEVKAR